MPRHLEGARLEFEMLKMLLSARGTHTPRHPMGPGPATEGCNRQAGIRAGGSRRSCRSRCPLKGETCGEKTDGRSGRTQGAGTSAFRGKVIQGD